MNILDLFKRNHKEENVTDLEDERQINATLLDLNKKVISFLDWYKTYLINKKEFNEFQANKEISIVKNLIEKVASFYEIAYPDNNIVEIISNMYHYPDYKNFSLIDYNLFFDNLNGKEKTYLTPPHCANTAYVDKSNLLTHFSLSDNGIITGADYIAELDKVCDSVMPPVKFYIGKPISEVIAFLKDKNIIKLYNELELIYNNYHTEKTIYDELLNSIMYRIIERGGHRVGPCRAFLYAKDFNTNIEIPISYACDYSDQGLRYLINEYFKSGGKQDLVCYNNYFFRQSDSSMIEKINLHDLNNMWLNAAQKYTEEEQDLHAKLVNLLATNIKEQEKNNALRLQKKN